MTRLEKLKKLETKLTKVMAKEDGRNYAALAKQYRETIREIDEIEGSGAETDDISEIIKKRAASGKPGAVRKSGAKV